MSSTDDIIDGKNPIPPGDRIAVDAANAARLMSCGRSTFFARVRAGMYPRAGRDGLWSVSQLRACRDRLAEPEAAQT